MLQSALFIKKVLEESVIKESLLHELSLFSQKFGLQENLKERNSIFHTINTNPRKYELSQDCEFY